MKICQECNKEYNRKKAKKYCSSICSEKGRKRRNRSNSKESYYKIRKKLRICQECNKEYDRFKSHKYCSLICEAVSRRKRNAANSRKKYRIKKGIDPNTPITKKPKGSGWIRKDGYKIVYKKNHPNARANGSLFEHWIVMSEYLGRPLRKGENVHHKNGIRDDNRIENLELWTKSQPAGQRVEDKIKWAKEFLKNYGYKVSKTRKVDFSVKQSKFIQMDFLINSIPQY